MERFSACCCDRMSAMDWCMNKVGDVSGRGWWRTDWIAMALVDASMPGDMGLLVTVARGAVAAGVFGICGVEALRCFSLGVRRCCCCDEAVRCLGVDGLLATVWRMVSWGVGVGRSGCGVVVVVVATGVGCFVAAEASSLALLTSCQGVLGDAGSIWAATSASLWIL